MHPRTLLQAAARSIEAHGGGIRGLANVAVRAFKVIRALGLRGFTRRLASAGRAPPAPAALPDAHRFPDPAPLAALQMRVGVVAHVFYDDLIDEFADYLARMPVPFCLFVSVMDEASRHRAQARFAQLEMVTRLEIRIVPNRGRDIAPMLVTFREEVLSLDVVAHIHTKKSLYSGNERQDWRHYLLDSLLGSADRIARHLGRFQADPLLGILYPESFPGVPAWAHTWLSNFDVCRELGHRLGLDIEPGRYFDFPAGSMFWARVAALRPLFALRLRLDDFPDEQGQTDGTLQHAIERLLVPVIREQGFVAAIDNGIGVSTEGQRNWIDLFAIPIQTRIALSALDAKFVTSDLFDTLVVRPFLTPGGARAYLSYCVERRFGISGFSQLRVRAETKARGVAGSDVCLDEIYRVLGELADAQGFPISDLQALELELEARHLTARSDVVTALSRLEPSQGTLILSDMYLSSEMLEKVLPNTVAGLSERLLVSCETGLRKDSDRLWRTFPQELSVSPRSWLHIGDNEHSDIQMPQKHGLATPVHVIRPSALLDAHPAFRPLRPARFESTSWPDQLWLGLLANRFARQMDRSPGRWIPQPVLDPEDVGYCVLGPLLVDYLLWLAQQAEDRRCDTILFLSREGHLLSTAFSRLQDTIPAISPLKGRYFLTSRRASGMASLRTASDLSHLMRGTYNGTVAGLLQARLGKAATASVQASIGVSELARDIYLPEMHDHLIGMLAPALPGLLDLAEQERDAYQLYWRECVGDRRPIVADIGYSGSIQASLARMRDAPIDGAYFALDPRSTTALQGQWATARYHDGRKMESESTILRHDLLLEALLSAPHPQLSHFVVERGEAEARYGEPELGAPELDLLKLVHTGALDFIDAIGAACGEDMGMQTFDSALVQRPLYCLGTGLWSAPWLASLSVDDTFTGRGKVRPS